MEIVLNVLKLGLVLQATLMWCTWGLLRVVPNGYVMIALTLSGATSLTSVPEAQKVSLLFLAFIAPLVIVCLWVERERFKIAGRIRRLDRASYAALTRLLTRELKTQRDADEAGQRDPQGPEHIAQTALARGEHNQLERMLRSTPSAPELLNLFPVHTRRDVATWQGWLEQVGSKTKGTVAVGR